MTLTDIENSLPNGLHDAELVAMQIDYANHIAFVDVNVDCSDPDDDTTREDYRPARLAFGGIQFVVIDPPSTSATQYRGLPFIAVGHGQPDTSPLDLPSIREGYFLCWIFVAAWSGFIRISAQDVTIEWRMPAQKR